MVQIRLKGSWNVCLTLDISHTVHYEKAWAERIRPEPGVEENTIRNGDFYMLQYNLQASLKL